jgi:ABC-2 type transport system ATP-binding protein
MLKATSLVKNYGSFQALKGIDLEVKDGEIYCLLGANGAGKSTTINIFLGFIRPDEGLASIHGLDVTKQGLETKKYITYIPENLMLYNYLTGYENLEYFCKLSGRSFSKPFLEAFLVSAGLQKDFMHKKVFTYSKGMRQKVGIALAMAKDTRALLLDEPTSGLDPKASNEFSELLLRLKAKGVAILMATHDIFRAKETATRIGIMKNGSLVETLAADAVSTRELESIYLQHMHN